MGEEGLERWWHVVCFLEQVADGTGFFACHNPVETECGADETVSGFPAWEGSLGKLASLSGGGAGDLSARVKALRDVSEAYKSYTGLPEGESGKVKFIYRTDSIEAPDAE